MNLTNNKRQVHTDGPENHHVYAESVKGALSNVSRGLPTLLEFSRQCKDVELHDYLMSEPEKVLVYNKCRRLCR